MKYALGKRKVQRICRSLMVAIPPTWCKNNNLNKSEEVNFFVNEDGLLCLEPVKNETEKTE
ncbi:MAG: AbrB/MazE/SpoVT family DNA-binding domain-containing protein [Candidatus Woesearchaeota archaeon]